MNRKVTIGGMPTRARSILERMNITRWEDAAQRTTIDFLMTKNCGKVTLQAIRHQLALHGMTLADERPDKDESSTISREDVIGLVLRKALERFPAIAQDDAIATVLSLLDGDDPIFRKE